MDLTANPVRTIKALIRQLSGKCKDNVLKLYELASELKAEVEKTDVASTLSLSAVKTAQEIEKLAKKIKNLSRG